MNKWKWQAIASMVKSFNENDRPGYALAVVIVMSLSPVAGVAILTVLGY